MELLTDVEFRRLLGSRSAVVIGSVIVLVALSVVNVFNAQWIAIGWCEGKGSVFYAATFLFLVTLGMDLSVIIALRRGARMR